MLWNKICEKYSTNTGSLFKIFKRNHITKSRIKNKEWDLEKKALLKEMYLNNSSYKEMCNALNCKESSLVYWVKKLNLPMRGSGKKNIYPNKFLENTIESNYWLGYIFADGHINYTNRNYSVSLSSEKEYVIDSFIKWYNNIPSKNVCKYILKDGTIKHIYKAILYSKDITIWFKNIIGIESSKHHTLNPNIELNWDIIRGFFDGDGSSANKQWQLKSCSKTWLKRIQIYLQSFGINTTLKLSYKDCYGLYSYKKEETIKIANLMYNNNYFCHIYKYKNLEPYMSNHIKQIG